MQLQQPPAHHFIICKPLPCAMQDPAICCLFAVSRDFEDDQSEQAKQALLYRRCLIQRALCELTLPFWSYGKGLSPNEYFQLEILFHQDVLAVAAVSASGGGRHRPRLPGAAPAEP